MYAYNLIIKRGNLDHDEANVMVMMEITERFDSLIRFNITAILDNEVIVTVRNESKRWMQTVLGEWFGEDAGKEAPFRTGALLHYREILSNEPLYNKLGG